MDFISIKFAVFVMLALTAFSVCPKARRMSVIMPFINLAFLATFVTDLRQLAPLGLFLAAGFVSIKMIERFPTRANMVAALAAILAVFVYLKKYTFLSFVPALPWPYLMVGLSYILFRVLHLAADIYGGAIKERISSTVFFNYTCSFLTFIAGPIQRYEEFAAQAEAAGEKAVSQDQAFSSFSRMLNGLLKIAILSPFLLAIHSEFLSRVAETRYALTMQSAFITYVGASFFYTLYLYINFSGYMDVVISIGRFFGFDLPENFNKPLSRSRSFLDLWSRWHMTLSDWFKFYVFNPLVKFMTYKRENPALIPYYAVAAFFVTFLLMGIWHGTSYSFVVFGLFLAFGTSVNKLYDIVMRRLVGKKAYGQLCDKGIYAAICSGLTFSYFSMGLTCLWLDFDRLISLFSGLGIAGSAVIFILGGLLAAAIIVSYRALTTIVSGMRRLIWRAAENFYLKQLGLSFKAFVLLLFVVSKLQTVPEFIYKAF
ncbi:MAG: hypothetical protein PHT32_04400 [Candidatus Omnitrophica bacterium]|nr:hypothetical protein [Candidatus Omnitrophota bacterium]